MTSVVAPTNRKLDPTPFSVSEMRKCQSSRPVRATITPSRRISEPTAITLTMPKRAIRLPVKNDGMYMPMTWRKITQGGSVAGRPLPANASRPPGARRP